MRRPKPRQLRLAFADSPKGGGSGRTTGEPEGKSFLLRIASARETKGLGAPAAESEQLLETASGQGWLPGFERYRPEEPDVRPTSPVL